MVDVAFCGCFRGSSLAQNYGCFFLFFSTLLYILVTGAYKKTWDGTDTRVVHNTVSMGAREATVSCTYSVHICQG